MVIIKIKNAGMSILCYSNMLYAEKIYRYTYIPWYNKCVYCVHTYMIIYTKTSIIIRPKITSKYSVNYQFNWLLL